MSCREKRKIFSFSKNAIKIDADKNMSIFVNRLKIPTIYSYYTKGKNKGQPKYENIDHSQLKISRREKSKNRIPETNNHEGKILRDNGKYYLILITENNYKPDLSEKSGRLISFDPGSKTFQTGYCPDGEVYKFGKNFKLTDKYDSIAELQSKLSDKTNIKTKYNLRKKNSTNELIKALASDNKDFTLILW
jgi:hypothetical protein